MGKSQIPAGLKKTDRWVRNGETGKAGPRRAEPRCGFCGDRSFGREGSPYNRGTPVDELGRRPLPALKAALGQPLADFSGPVSTSRTSGDFSYPSINKVIAPWLGDSGRRGPCGGEKKFRNGRFVTPEDSASYRSVDRFFPYGWNPALDLGTYGNPLLGSHRFNYRFRRNSEIIRYL
jgi:hypothetical protein